MSMSHVKSFEHKSIELKNWAGPEVNNDIDNRRKGGFLFLLEIKKTNTAAGRSFFYE